MVVGFEDMPGQTFLTLLYLIITHWFSQSISIFRYMLSVRA